MTTATRQASASMRLEFHGASVRAARERLRQVLRDSCAGARVDDVRIVISELVANSLRHARPLEDDTLAVDWHLQPDVLRVSVTDGGSSTSVPACRRPGDLATGGRGLEIVQTLTRRWGVESDDVSTTVWAELPLA